RGLKSFGARATSAYIHRPAFELYDLAKDPLESRNLADDPRYAHVLNELKAKLKAFQRRTGDPWIVKWDYEYVLGPVYNWRNAIRGSTALARRAGTSHATRAAPRRTRPVTRTTGTLSAPVPKSMLCMVRPSAYAPARPTTRPPVASVAPSRRI